jgi:hypothetical protein
MPRIDFAGVPSELVWTVAGAAALIALTQTVRLWWRDALLRWRLRARGERAAAGERRAERLLVALGYEIVARQAVTTWAVRRDDELVHVELRADLLVTRDGLRYVAEVKTGQYAPQITTAATRRQLLEYRMAFEVDGVLLVNAERDTVTEIGFELPGPAPAPNALVPALAWLVVGVMAGLAFARAFPSVALAH